MSNLENNEDTYVDVIDLDNKKIKLLKDSFLYYTDENDINYSIRVDFKEIFGSLENYMRIGYEPILLEEFNEKQLKEDDYEGTFVLKVILDDHSILNHYYTFIGFEDEDTIKVAPVKIPKLNRYTVDPTRVISINWYYLESKDNSEYVINDFENIN